MTQFKNKEYRKLVEKVINNIPQGTDVKEFSDSLDKIVAYDLSLNGSAKAYRSLLLIFAIDDILIEIHKKYQ